MVQIITVMIGGAIGSAARYLVGLVAPVALPGTFPAATLAVNLCGGFLMGMLAAFVVRGSVDDTVRLFAGVGVLGGFTTFSAFSLDCVLMIERGHIGMAVVYSLMSVVGSISLAGIGMAVAHGLGTGS